MPNTGGAGSLTCDVGRNREFQPKFFPKRERYDLVEEEIENRRPLFQRLRTRAIVAILLAMLIWLVARLLGIDVPLPIHFL
jgi:hypothetical protein